MNYGLVEAEGRHIGALVRLSSELFAEDAGSRDPLTDVGWPTKHGWDHFSNLITRDDAACFLTFFGRTPVGYLAGLVYRPTAVRPVRIAELQSMYVAPGHRGRRLGERLVGRFRLWAREQEADRMAVTAYASNEGAIRFYERVGFQPRAVSLEAGS